MKHHHARKHRLHFNRYDFIHQAAVPAQQSELLTGVPASITIAQAILESGWGKHHIGKANNYFGVKAHKSHGKIDPGTVATGYVDVSTREHIKGNDITIVDHFRKYNSMSDSFIDHGLFLKKNKRYSTALANYSKSGDADAFAQGLQDAGYATDPHYADLLTKIMTKFSLYQYNKKQSAR